MEVALPILAFRPGPRLHATPAHDGTGGVAVHTHGKTKRGFFPLPVGEAKRLSKHLSFHRNSPPSIRASVTARLSARSSKAPQLSGTG